MDMELKTKALFWLLLQVCILSNLVIGEGQMEKYKNKERQRVYWSGYTCHFLIEMGLSMEEYKKKERQEMGTIMIVKANETRSVMDLGFLGLDDRGMRIERMGTIMIVKANETRSAMDLGFLRLNALIYPFQIHGGQSRRKLFERKLDEILENWLKTEGKSTDAVDFLRNYQPLPPKEAMSNKERNMKHHGMLPMSGQTGRYVVQGGAQKERGKLIENPELSGKFDDAEKDIQELEQLLRCKVCLDSDACIVFLPCRHMSTCEYCEGFLHHCPVCRSFIEEAVKINEE